MQFIDLKSQQARIKTELDNRIATVLDHGIYIMGPEVDELEANLAYRANSEFCITCASGTDALVLSLKALGFTKQDVVFVPAFTFAATAEAVVLAGCTPYFVDVDKGTFMLSIDSLKSAIIHARRASLKPKCVIGVGIFGAPLESSLREVCSREKMVFIDDAAQSFGSLRDFRPTGSLADITTTSFFPAKPLACYGDGGAIFTDNQEFAEVLLSLRVHGKGKNKYDNVRIGMNSRLDTLQAAVLLAKLTIFDSELDTRNQLAKKFRASISDNRALQELGDTCVSAWASFGVVVADRNESIALLNRMNIPHQIYYPEPVASQPAYRHFPSEKIMISEQICTGILNLPIHPYLSDAQAQRICEFLQYSESC